MSPSNSSHRNTLSAYHQLHPISLISWLVRNVDLLQLQRVVGQFFICVDIISSSSSISTAFTLAEPAGKEIAHCVVNAEVSSEVLS
eukprot:scaffold13701_cov86-Skeletonema_dohrnii-CCMP3373.AAC.2